MRTLSSADLVDLWDRGSSLHPVDRSLVLLHTVLPETYEHLADWPLGRRNQALAELRGACFGSRLEAWTACPRCGEKLEFQMDTRSLVAPLAPAHDAINIKGESFRPPNSRDLAIAKSRLFGGRNDSPLMLIASWAGARGATSERVSI